MATLLDVGLFQHFSVVFTFLLLFAVIYAFLSASKLLKSESGGNGINAIIALCIAFLGVMSRGVVSIISRLTSWFTALIILTFLIFFVLRMWTGDDDAFFKDLIKKNSGVYWVVIVIFILIVIAAFSTTFGQNLLEQNPQVRGQTPVSTGNGTAVVRVDNTQTTQIGQVPATATGDFQTNIVSTIFHPKVLGLGLILLIAFFAILFLARSTFEPDK